MAILVNYKDKYDTTTTTENNSMGFDLSAIQSCFDIKIPLTTSPRIYLFIFHLKIIDKSPLWWKF